MATIIEELRNPVPGTAQIRYRAADTIDALVAALEGLLKWEDSIWQPSAQADIDAAEAALALARKGGE